MSQRPILVLGASSLIGGFLLEWLTQAGLPFAAVSRQARDGWLQADLATPEGRAALPDATVVLCLAPVWVMTPDVLTALKAVGMTRLVAFSSTSVVTKAGSPDPHERAVARELDRGEAAVRASGIDWTLLRPTMIYAEGRDANVSRLVSMIRRFGVLPLAGEGGGRRQPVHAGDLATAALQALASPTSANRAYDLAGGETLTYREMVERLFQAVNRPARIISIPEPLWRAGLTMLAPLLPGVTGEMGARMDRDLVFDDRAARADFGWNPRRFEPKF